MDEKFILQCHNCFKILNNQPDKNAIGPDHVICSQCGTSVPTPFIPWIETPFWRKFKMAMSMFIAVAGGIYAFMAFMFMPLLKGAADLFTDRPSMFTTPEIHSVAYIYLPIFSGLVMAQIMCRQYRTEK